MRHPQLKAYIKTMAFYAKELRGAETKAIRAARASRHALLQEGSNLGPEDMARRYNIFHRLHLTRTVTARQEARAAQLAYGYLRGRRLDQIEQGAKNAPNWHRVFQLIKGCSYGPSGEELIQLDTEIRDHTEELRISFENWIRTSSLSVNLKP